MAPVVMSQVRRWSKRCNTDEPRVVRLVRCSRHDHLAGTQLLPRPLPCRIASQLCRFPMRFWMQVETTLGIWLGPFDRRLIKQRLCSNVTILCDRREPAGLDVIDEP